MPRFSSLRVRLILLVSLAFIPALALILYTNWNHRRHTLREAEKECLTLARAAAHQQNGIIEDARVLLFTLAQIPQVKERDVAACNAIFANLLKNTNRYAAFNLVNLNGVPIAGAPLITEPVTFAERRWFPRLLVTKDFVVGEYLGGKGAEKPILVFAGRVFDAAGNFVAIVTASIDLKWLNDFFAATPLPEGAPLTVVDRDGTVLARHPDPEGLVGRTIAEADIITTLISREEGVALAPDLDEVQKIFGFTTMGPPDARVRVAVGIPKAQVVAEAQKELMVNLIALLLVTAVVLGVAWFGGDALVLRPAQTLLSVTRRLRQGDLTARTGPPYAGGELGQLAQAFDEMAEGLQRREAERQEAEERLQRTARALRVLTLCNEALIRATGEGDLLQDVCRIIVETGEYLMAFVGYALDDEARTVRPAAWAGREAGFLETAKITWADDQWGQGPTGTAIRTGSTCIIRDVQTDPAVAPWREEALRRGYAAALGLPLQVAGQTIGGLTIVAVEGQAFDPDAAKLLEELANDLSYGIEALRTRAERQRAQEEKAELEAQLFQAQKMEAIGRLAGGLAHDFNNILGVIIGYSEMMLTNLPQDDLSYKRAAAIRKAADRAASLTRQLLAFSRRQTLQPRVMNLNDLVADFEKMLGRVIGEDIDLNFFLKADQGMVKVDPGQLEQVIMNLAINARDAMPQGGRLTIETAELYLDADYASRHAEVIAGDYVMLAVSDTGVGMDAETQAHIFEPFFTTKEEGKGTGLGLAMVYGIVKQSGGHIWVYSEPGAGTTFKIYFPRVEEAAHSPTMTASPAASLRGTETILLAEDDDMLRDITSEALQMQGYTVLEARTGGAALRMAQDHQGPIHLLLTDVVMPEISGRALAERLLSLYPEIRVIYVSGYTANAIAQNGILDSGVNFIQKPISPFELVRKVREVLDISPDR